MQVCHPDRNRIKCESLIRMLRRLNSYSDANASNGTMFPIIPSHILRQPIAPVGNRMNDGSDRNLRLNFWSVEDLIKRSRSQKLYATSPVTSSSVSEKSERLAEGCFASSFLPKDIKSYAVKSAQSYRRTGEVRRIVLRINSAGYLESEDGAPEEVWFKQIRLSNDTHSNNALLETTSTKQLRIRVVKPVHANDELLLWFSEEVSALMDVPFLTPSNIRGKNNYTCNLCEKTYEYPNPLKMHIATRCDRGTQEDLWGRLEQSLPRNFIFHPLYSPPTQWAIHPPTYPSHRPELSPPNNPSRNSAFQPVMPPRYPLITATAAPTPSTDQTAIASAAAHLETIVSNMGTSKQGHLCIYCGKLYSRKYGLKIHIRTHTGFKPLKCKFCFRPFGDPSNLNKHVRLHVQGANNCYKCHLCDKILIRRRDLQRHMQTRHSSHGEDNSGEEGEGSNNAESSSNTSNSASSDEEVSDCDPDVKMKDV